MRLDDERESDNVEDRRGQSGGLPGMGSLGLGGVVIALVASWFLGVDPRVVLGVLQGGAQAPSAQSPPLHSSPRPAAEDQKAHFVARVLASTEDTWGAIFQAAGKHYDPPKLVLFTGSYPTGCGTGQAAAGPFYCPTDRKVYIDLQFYQVMRDRFHAASDFAETYVVAHEVGHHVQNLEGVAARMANARQRVSTEQYNALSVKMELQADCLAGVWANRTDQAKHFLQPGDVEGALAAASAIGDDTLQKQAQGYAVPDSFTHGTSEQRMRWLKRGLDSGQVRDCDTWKAQAL